MPIRKKDIGGFLEIEGVAAHFDHNGESLVYRVYHHSDEFPNDLETYKMKPTWCRDRNFAYVRCLVCYGIIPIRIRNIHSGGIAMPHFANIGRRASNCYICPNTFPDRIGVLMRCGWVCQPFFKDWSKHKPKRRKKR